MNETIDKYLGEEYKTKSKIADAGKFEVIYLSLKATKGNLGDKKNDVKLEVALKNIKDIMDFLKSKEKI
jgi:hypothetical protein